MRYYTYDPPSTLETISADKNNDAVIELPSQSLWLYAIESVSWSFEKGVDGCLTLTSTVDPLLQVSYQLLKKDRSCGVFNYPNNGLTFPHESGVIIRLSGKKAKALAVQHR